MDAILKTHQLGATYGGRPVLHGIDLKIPEHQITAIIGPSGCGKTTLLKCMNGMLRDEPDAAITGEVYLAGAPISAMRADELRRRVGLVFQTPSPFPFSIAKNITYAPRYYGERDREKLDAIVREMLERTGLYEEVKDDLHRSALRLSGGQQQRLCIARALSVKPDVLLLDEPCSALDVKASAVIESLLLELKRHYTIVIVTHNIAQAKRISDFVAFLSEGRLVECAPADRFFAAPQEEQTRGFLEGLYG